jgi:hypothetical protein
MRRPIGHRKAGTSALASLRMLRATWRPGVHTLTFDNTALTVLSNA